MTAPAFGEALSPGHGGAAACSETADRSDRPAGRGDMAGVPTDDADRMRVSDPTFLPTDAPIARNSAQSILVVRERLVVGKRDVGLGGVGVRSDVVEAAIEGYIALCADHVALERRSGDQPLTTADGLLQEGEITLEETEEVPVVAKEAVVMQDIILVNGATERMETVQDMVRRTEVDVEDTRPSTSAMPA